MDICITLFGGVFIGAVVGCILTKMIFKPKYAGILRLYNSEPDGDLQLYLQLDELPENLSECEYVTFKTQMIDI